MLVLLFEEPALRSLSVSNEREPVTFIYPRNASRLVFECILLHVCEGEAGHDIIANLGVAYVYVDVFGDPMMIEKAILVCKLVSFAYHIEWTLTA